MSIPHTGHLTAEIDRERYTFDGDRWKGPSGQLLNLLNEVTDNSPKQHYSIKDRAEYVWRELQLDARARVLEWSGDGWEKELPPGAID